MNAERWKRVEDLYVSALAMDASERGRYLAERCGDDDELRAEIDSLLAHADDGEELLERFEVKLPPAQPKAFELGALLGTFRITGKLGEGGMGVVYKATDTQLGRPVAIKLVRPDLIDSSTAVRFRREARLLASLNHPNVAAIYGFHEQDGMRYLVLEYVAGDTLADHLARGPMRVQEALLIARQVADALEAAHQVGIIHRDLKPANVKVTAAGDAKVLDFGLAKPLQRVLAAGEDPATQTVATVVTRGASILGTPAYMSPEQACGKPLDTRTDVWAFGCVLYECLTGKLAFGGQTVTEVLSGIIEREPDWSALPANVPDQIGWLLRRCLTKDPRNRLRHIGDARIIVDEALSAPVKSVEPRRRGFSRLQLAGLASAGLVPGILIAVLTGLPSWRNPSRDMVAFSVGAPEGMLLSVFPGAPSPDGKRIAFVANDSNGTTAIWIRPLGSEAAQKIAGTEGGTGAFWSPDGRYLAFKTGTKLMKVDPAGGPAQTICDARGDLGASWGAAGDIVFSPANRAPLYRVPASGGTPQQITTLDEKRQENSHRWPHFLPDGKHFLFTARSSLKENTAIYVGSLDSKETKRLFDAQSQAEYVPGYIVFAREGSVVAQKFDVHSLQISGEPVPVVAHVEHNTASAAAYFATSSDGTVLLNQRSMQRTFQLSWSDRKGVIAARIGEPHDYTQPRISPDGKRIAIVITDATSGNRDIWIMDIATQALSRFTSHPANDWYPAWSPDGSHIAFASDRGPKSAIYQKAVNGSGDEEFLVTPPEGGGAFGPDYSPDGHLLMYQVDGVQVTDLNLWILPFANRRAYAWATSPFREYEARFSPDGKWVAFVCNETGSNEVYIRRLDRPEKKRISLAGGGHPVWRRDGRELFFSAPDFSIMAVEVRAGEDFDAGSPAKLFQACGGAGQARTYRGAESFFDVSADGSRFLTSCMDTQMAQRTTNVLVHWSALLDQKKN